MHELSKPEFDIGFFTNRIDATLAFWREEIGLTCEKPVYFNDGLVQYRHRLNNSVIKINGAENGVSESAAGGYGELFIARDDIAEQSTHVDPNGQIIHLVPPGTHGITHLGFEMLAADIETEKSFLLNAMGFHEESTEWLRAGNCQLMLKQEPGRPYAAHWVNSGFRYFTFHVMNVEQSFNAIIESGGTVGERPYAIGDIAKISFVRSPAGNWIEVAQRRELAGPW
ncbi:MAG: VOC family protein [Gammaproteobacteria bacterium]